MRLLLALAWIACAAASERVAVYLDPAAGQPAQNAARLLEHGLRTRRVDVRPLLSAQIPLSRSLEAFELASDRSRSTKVQVVCD